MNPNEVQTTITLNLPSVNLILAALGKLPFEQVDNLIQDIRACTLQALRLAEESANSPLPVLDIDTSA